MAEPKDNRSNETKHANNGLTLLQWKWVQAYLGGAQGNATLACKQAGYKGSDGAMHKQGHRNVTNAKIRQEIQAQRAELTKDIGPEWVKQQAIEQFQAIKDEDRANARGYLDMVGRITGAYADPACKGNTAPTINIVLPEGSLKAIEGKDLQHSLPTIEAEVVDNTEQVQE